MGPAGASAIGARVGQLRCKTYTSNVMDEERSRRLAEEYAYHKARKDWKRKMGALKTQWLAEINKSAITAALEATRQQAMATAARHAQRRAVDQAAKQRTLAEQIQRAEMDVLVVSAAAVTCMHVRRGPIVLCPCSSKGMC